MSNKYHDILYKDGNGTASCMTAEDLLGLMRPEVEAILKKYWPESTAPSQSTRAVKVLLHIERMLEQAAMFSPEKKELRADMAALHNFMAVWRTCWILEGRAL